MVFPFSQNVVFFIGTGFTKAIAETAPAGDELLLKAFTTPAYYEDLRIQNVKKFIVDIYKTLSPRIEDVLSLVDYSIRKQEALSIGYSLQAVKKIRNDIIYLIAKVTSEFRYKMQCRRKPLFFRGLLS